MMYGDIINTHKKVLHLHRALPLATQKTTASVQANLYKYVCELISIYVIINFVLRKSAKLCEAFEARQVIITLS